MATRVTLQQLKQAAADHPRDAAALNILAWAHAGRREEDEAIDALERATRLEPSGAQYFLGLAKVLSQQQQWERAVQACRTALTLAPGHVEAAATLGWLCEHAGDRASAVEAYTRAIALAPNEPDAYAGLHSAIVPGRSADEVAAVATAAAPAVALAPLMRIGLASALGFHGRYPEAVERWTAILREPPDHPLALMRAAMAHGALGNFEECERLLMRALALQPADNDLILTLFDLYFRTGRVEAIRERLRDPQVLGAFMETFDTPADGPRWWNGTQDLEGKTILLEARGGYGDGLHYGRVLPLLQARGARVIVRGFPQLSALLGALPGVDEFVAPFEPCPPYDYECRLKHILFLLDWTWDWIAETVPYVRADPAAVRAWRARFDPARLNVGIVWMSRAVESMNIYTFRSAPLAAFEPLSRVPGVTLHGLQVGPGAAEVTPATKAWLPANLEEECRDFGQAAAAIEVLDAVVSVDTSIAHLTGALGRPGFFLLPRCPDSRWMTAAPTFTNRACPWYPSARLYVQERPGDWGSVITQVAADLTHVAAARCPAALV